MLGKLPLAGVFCVALVALLLAASAAAGQDTFTDVERIVAVGDVHGDFGQFVAVLRAAALINDRNDWAGGKTHLVQTGDVFDRGPDSRKVMDLLMKLEVQAAKTGGAVHALIGNHEAMMLLGDWRYANPDEVKAFGTADDYRRALSAQGRYGKWLRAHNALIKVNDILFAHAGILPKYAERSLAEINSAVREQLESGKRQGITMEFDGPLWTRKLALGDEGELAQQLDVVFKRLGAKHMVIGHTVDTSGVLTRADGRLIRIDVGMSGCYGGPAACLVVEKGVCYEVRHPDGRRKLELGAPAEQPAPTQTDR